MTKGGRAPAVKGGKREREIVKLHKAIGVHAERVPLSGAARFQGNGQDIEITYFERGAHPYTCKVLQGQVKAMAGPTGIKGVIDALGEADVLFIRIDRQPGEVNVRPPLVVLPWATWEGLWKLLLK